MDKIQAIRPLLFLLLCGIILAFFIQRFVVGNPLFGPATIKEGPEVSWEEYLADRQRRNIKKMNLSYTELMSYGDAYAEQERWGAASDYYYNAKTLFPSRLSPRKNLCYTYLRLCPKNGRYCRYAKREVYYAMNYLDNGSKEDKEYFQQLIDYLDISDLVEMDEGKAMATIF